MPQPQFKIVTDWIITARCPLRCEHCIVGELVENAKDRKDQELTTQECKDLIDYLFDHGSRVLSITGGEALTRKDLPEIMDYGRERGMKVFLYTTGLPFINLITGKLNTQRITQVLSRVDFLGISLDTFHDDAYREIRLRDYCEQLVGALFEFASKHYPNLKIQLFTVLGRRNGTASVSDVIGDCAYVADVIRRVSASVGVRIRWRISPFRFNPGSMLPYQRKLLFSAEEIDRITNALKERFGSITDFSMHFGVDYDSFFVYPDGKFRTVQLDENGIDRFIELGTFRDKSVLRPDIWNELLMKDGQTALRMERKDILALHGKGHE